MLSKNSKKPKKIKYPVKRTINLVKVGEESKNLKIAVPSIILIILFSVLFSKVAVVDRLQAVAEAQSKVAVAQQQVHAGYAKIESYGELKEKYAHYTYSGMTEEELSRADRIEILDLMERVVMKNAVVGSWSISENEMILVITGTTLQEINEIVHQLESEDLVDFCTVMTAATNQKTSEEAIMTNEAVTAQVTVYFNKVMEKEEQ